MKLPSSFGVPSGQTKQWPRTRPTPLRQEDPCGSPLKDNVTVTFFYNSWKVTLGAWYGSELRICESSKNFPEKAFGKKHNILRTDFDVTEYCNAKAFNQSPCQSTLVPNLKKKLDPALQLVTVILKQSDTEEMEFKTRQLERTTRCRPYQALPDCIGVCRIASELFAQSLSPLARFQCPLNSRRALSIGQCYAEELLRIALN